uniref:SHOCT domain-containing protein n=1 Tax=Octactis speculum TaxID=3111310 RepID=A0A7S2HS87_9STRA|mmetsp:Transcript_9070/g.11584  ORF Transcript_9070/g.11584 Transcript_9070/m.11584 type:complete len:306 (+) Transcript_9070:223-1140(+)|eukprot:CAMPEP_0185774958 /NCGR_PEP_ID=MMETSP1174-20130828/80554_1 /TAXON_ID=35687 /ORGANISM="Dictyocha speculum, Strain CCMP1381" /LENGTH=305 /DNA_ID=CAMNT_0028462375 /DNA_START=223 /DNA_END=1140 /DNA_ORIENTATION=-
MARQVSSFLYSGKGRQQQSDSTRNAATHSTGIDKLQNDITGVLGGSYESRWCVLMGGGEPGPEWGGVMGSLPHKSIPLEFVIYPSYQDTAPMVVLPAKSLHIVEDSVGQPSTPSLFNALGFPQTKPRESVRFLLNSPHVGYRLRLEAKSTIELERWREALQACPQEDFTGVTDPRLLERQQQVPQETPSGVDRFVDSDRRNTRGDGEPRLGRSIQPVQAVPVDGSHAMMAEAVIIESKESESNPLDDLCLPSPPGMMTPTAPSKTGPADERSIVGMIKELKELVDLGAITQSEFEEKKLELLKRI